MRLLLDTHTVLWFDGGDKQLSRSARTALEDPSAELIVSAATIWEMAIKSGIGRLTLPKPIGEYVDELQHHGYRILPITGPLVARVADLPHHHRDPFDRLLAVQALAEQMPLVTGDKIFKKYGVKTIW